MPRKAKLNSWEKRRLNLEARKQKLLADLDAIDRKLIGIDVALLRNEGKVAGKVM